MLQLHITLYLILSQFILSEECPQVFFEALELFVVSQSALNPLAQLIVDDLFLIPFINQEDACVVALVSYATANNLVYFPDSSHFVPIVTCYLLVVIMIV